MKFEKEDLVKLYRNLVRTRAFDEAAVRWLAQGKLLAFYHPAQGGEAPGVGGCTFLRDDDIVYPHLRGHGLPHMIGKGISPKLYLAEHCGKATGAAGGMGGFHSVFPEKGALGAGGTIGSCFPVSVGWALAAKKNGRGQVVVCFFGDGSANRGTWHEAAKEDLSNLASAFGMPAVVVDGQDVMAVAEAVTAAVERAREGKGPSFVECKTARFGPHGIGNPDKVHGKDRDPRQIEELKRRDPVALFRSRLLEQGVLTEEDAERISREAEAEVAETEAFIDQSPFPDDPGMLDRALYAE
ncbi:MAG: thiamine pyrophosphate-dependent dehydrogenase E1 component subunit alpha [Deltaproteobacteria bacterium]|nr:thiamine pyrophosphate-dependent dehydrogenase E1 component subunit alpha [Deltaproteobacteria bacterium]